MIVLALLTTLLSVVAPLVSSSAHADPGTPGVPGAPKVLYFEDFEQGTGTTLLEDYAAPVGYTADPYWLSTRECNGFVASASVPARPAGYCASNYPAAEWSAVQAKTYALGLLNTPQNPESNRAVSSNTAPAISQRSTPNLIEFMTRNQLDLPNANGRFVTFSVDAAATACRPTNDHPLLRFYFREASGTEIPVSESAINPCTDPRATSVTAPGGIAVKYGNFAANGSILLNSSSVGIVMRNESSGAALGNDGAFDNIRVLDATPQLDKSFSPQSVPVGGISTLTFTVTNTSDLAEKRGWAFRDTLPAGLVLAESANVGGSCQANVGASAGGDAIDVTNGVLRAGDSSCTITVDVTSATPRGADASPVVYENCAANISHQVGIDDPACASVEFFSKPELKIAKTSDAGHASAVGQTVHYAVQVTNSGTADFTASNPAVFTDDLSDVLDDATYNHDAAATFSGGSASQAPALDGTMLRWSGALKAGETATFTYSVTLTAAGNGAVVNTACVPEKLAANLDNCASTRTELPLISAAKSVDPESGTQVRPGQMVSYTLTFANAGAAAGSLSYVDDLSNVLDDADLVGDIEVSEPALSADRDHNRLTVSGTLEAGRTATVTYTVVVRANGERGDNVLGNLLASSDIPNPRCGDDGVTCTENPVGELVTWKSIDPASGTALRAGDTATYTLHFENAGAAPVEVQHDDVLDGVLDDADVTVPPVASTEALAVSDITDGRFGVAGQLAPGESATVSYTVQVKPDGERGDDRLGNFLVAHGAEPPATCDPAADHLPNCTVNPVSDVVAAKSSNPASGTEVQPGEEVTYTLTFTNRSKNPDAAASSIDYTDDMRDVLDDATVTRSPEVSSELLQARLDGDSIRIEGHVPSGETMTVTYTVLVKPYADQGNHSLANVVAVTGEVPVCAPNSQLCTVHHVPPAPIDPPAPMQPGATPPAMPPGLAVTGSSTMVLAGGAGAMLLLGGLVVTMLARRKVRAPHRSSDE